MKYIILFLFLASCKPKDRCQHVEYLAFNRDLSFAKGGTVIDKYPCNGNNFVVVVWQQDTFHSVLSDEAIYYNVKIGYQIP